MESMGVATGCGFKEIYRFPHTTYPYSSCICTFWQQHPYFFFHFVKMILRSFIIRTMQDIKGPKPERALDSMVKRVALRSFIIWVITS